MAQPRTRVLVVVIDLAGGTGTFCRLLATGLHRHFGGEFDVSILLMREKHLAASDRGLFRAVHVAGGDVHDDLRRLYETPLHALKLRRALRGITADLLLAVGTYANLLVPLIDARPAVLSAHTHHSSQLARARFGRITSALIRQAYPRHPIVAPTRGVAADLRRSFGVPPSKIHLIPHGLDAQRVRELAARPAAPLPTARPYAVAVGRLTPLKDYPTLLRAYARAVGGGLADDLIIIGDGEDRDALSELAASLGLAGRAHFVGHLDNPFPVMRSARYLVLSSVSEGFGMVLLEAMAVGLPCVSTNCPSGPADILEDGRSGLLVPPSDPAALAHAMLRLSTCEPLRLELAERSRLRAAELSLERMAASYRNLFLRCADGAQGHHA